jgi:hypothetical protein
MRVYDHLSARCMCHVPCLQASSRRICCGQTTQTRQARGVKRCSVALPTLPAPVWCPAGCSEAIKLCGVIVAPAWSLRVPVTWSSTQLCSAGGVLLNMAELHTSRPRCHTLCSRQHAPAEMYALMHLLMQAACCLTSSCCTAPASLWCCRCEAQVGSSRACSSALSAPTVPACCPPSLCTSLCFHAHLGNTKCLPRHLPTTLLQ